MVAGLTNPLDADDLLRSLLGGDPVRIGTVADAIDGVVPRFVAEPATAADLVRVLAMCNDAGLAVVPRGGGTKIGWGNPPRACDLLLSTRRLDRVIEHAAGDMTATVQAGCTVDAFQKVLASNGQRLAVDLLWPERATIGGILATNDSGALRHAFGPVRDSLIGITIALPDGTLAKSGGKVVKNVAGYDLPKLLIGSFGTLGVITEATFRLYPLAHASRTLCFAVKDASILARLLALVAEWGLLAAAVQIESADDQAVVVRIRVEAIGGALEAKSSRLVDGALQAGAVRRETTEAEWDRREVLFSPPDACVCKIALLPTQWPQLLNRLNALNGSATLRWQLIGQAVGVGLLAFHDTPVATLIDAITSLRAMLSSMGGSLVLLASTPAVKSSMDAWGDAGDAAPLMRRIKQQFDPKNTLSPGRFVGGI